MPSALAFYQAPKKGDTVIVVDPVSGQPHLTTITGRAVKSGESVFLHSEGNAWARPEDITVLPERFGSLTEVAREGLQDYYPVLKENLSAEVVLAILPHYADTGSTQEDYKTLRDALEVQAKRLQAAYDNAEPDTAEAPRPR